MKLYILKYSVRSLYRDTDMTCWEWMTSVWRALAVASLDYPMASMISLLVTRIKCSSNRGQGLCFM